MIDYQEWNCWVKIIFVIIIGFTKLPPKEFTTLQAIISRFVVYGLYYVEVGSLYAHFLESFYHIWVLNFVKSFLCIY